MGEMLPDEEALVVGNGCFESALKLRLVGCQYSIRIWESGEWQTRTAECRQRSANPLPGKQMVGGSAT
jgi:hypothetical protein